MLSYILILFFTAFLGGIAVLWIPVLEGRVYKLLLVFAGSYLFAITVVHLMPELMHTAADNSRVGLLVLTGFFLQLLLEYLSGGVEHGHLHGSSDTHHHHHIAPATLIIALCIHAFLEGTLLLHPVNGGEHLHKTNTLLAGVVLHKAPAAFALMSVLLHQLQKRWLAVTLLSLFALASPAGLLFSELVQSSGDGLQLMAKWVYPLVAGSFLHISTTIFFENSPEHNFNLHKLLVSLAGAMLAAMTELLS